MKRWKILVSLCILSLFLTSTLPVQAIENLEHKTEEEKNNIRSDTPIYDIKVDKNDKSAYNSIQDAINHAPQDSTIYVKTGVYSEIITINKKINLIGEDKDTTLINPTSKKNSYAVRITTSGVKLSGFSIQNKGEGLYTTGIKISVSGVTVENCDIFDTPIGIALWSSDNKITNSRFWGCEDEGIAFLGSPTVECNNNIIENCEFFDNCDGIELQYSSNNRISNCEFYDNTHAGIDAIGSSNNDNIISNCNIYNNKVFGIYLSRSSGNQITKCSLTDNKIMTTGSKDNTVTECTLGTIYLTDDSSITIEDCNLDESNIKTVNSEYQINNIVESEDNLYKIDSQKEIRNRIINRIRSILSLLNANRIRFRN